MSEIALNAVEMAILNIVYNWSQSVYPEWMTFSSVIDPKGESDSDAVESIRGKWVRNRPENPLQYGVLILSLHDELGSKISYIAPEDGPDDDSFWVANTLRPAISILEEYGFLKWGELKALPNGKWRLLSGSELVATSEDDSLFLFYNNEVFLVLPGPTDVQLFDFTCSNPAMLRRGLCITADGISFQRSLKPPSAPFAVNEPHNPARAIGDPADQLKGAARAAFIFVRSNPGAQGPEIARKIGRSVEHFYKAISPKIKALGVTNEGDGYFPPKPA